MSRKRFGMYPVVAILLLLLSCAAPRERPDETRPDTGTGRLKKHAADLKKFAARQNASTQIGILVDMTLPSWKKRLFVVNLENGSVLVSGLCSHGVCGDVNSEIVHFSNTPGSNCTSEGRYRLGIKYTGEFGLGYKLYGLDASNSNALKRSIVFHYYPTISNKENKPATRSDGCPMVSKQVFDAAAKLIDASDKPVLLWIYK